MRAIVFALVLTPGVAFAAGGDDDSPPTTTNTSTSCSTGLVWDDKTKSCVAPQDSRLDDQQRYEAVRELAYAGKLNAAQMVLATMSDQQAPEVLTYWGFINGKRGAFETAERFYLSAITQDPNNLLARSYYGQALFAKGELLAARDQWKEIVARGGRDSWPETSLRLAFETGQTYNY